MKVNALFQADYNQILKIIIAVPVFATESYQIWDKYDPSYFPKIMRFGRHSGMTSKFGGGCLIHI